MLLECLCTDLDPLCDDLLGFMFLLDVSRGRESVLNSGRSRKVYMVEQSGRQMVYDAGLGLYLQLDTSGELINI